MAFRASLARASGPMVCGFRVMQAAAVARGLDGVTGVTWAWTRYGEIQREPLPSGTLRGNSFAALVAAPLREAATVFANGRRAGSLWAPPYRLDITDFLEDGDNDIRIDVHNTAINRLAEGGHLPDMAALAERWGQRTRLQDLEGLRPLASGILTAPRIVAER